MMIEISRTRASSDFKADCLICAMPLVYLNEFQVVRCEYCGLENEAQVICQAGHYVCDACHGAPANQLIEQLCVSSTSCNPVELAISLMKNSKVKMHGPEHHFLVPAVLLTSYYNTLGKPEEKPTKIKQARKRAENVLGGFCGFYGACGAGVGTGIFISTITEATPLSTDAWKLSNQMTAESLKAIAALGGPRCCKRDTIIALRIATRFLKQHFDVSLKGNPKFPVNLLHTPGSVF